MEQALIIRSISRAAALKIVVAKHYLHRQASVIHAFALESEGVTVGVVTFGIPPSRHLQKSACPSNPDLVLELNRLWVSDRMPRNSESYFIARALKLLPPLIIVSYADLAFGHAGYVYRASNFFYAGWTDMERKTPRPEYKADGRHSRAAFRGEMVGAFGARSERRGRKVKYWIATGDRRERFQLQALCGWPKLSWRDQPPPGEKDEAKNQRA